MLDETLRYCNRLKYNDSFVKCTNPGTYTIAGGKLAVTFVAPEQCYCIFGSDFNDGAHAPGDTLTDETFSGSIWLLRLPPAFLALVNEMQEWQTKNGKAALSPYSSESFGNYSRSWATGKDGSAVTVWSQFSGRLNQWRKI